jgi:hypothetical protein
MAKTQDLTKVMQDMMSSFPVDATAVQGAFKTTAASAKKWPKWLWKLLRSRTRSRPSGRKRRCRKFGSLAKVKEEPADYTKAFSDFASAAAEMAAENLAAFAEVAKKVQMDTVELMLAAGKTASEDVSAAVQKATAEVTAAAKKAAQAAK